MAELSTDVRIFLSSTFVDLKELRGEIAQRLRDVFGAHLLVMESFGADAAPPVISAIRKVRESDVFIGIYARRYGAVDPAGSFVDKFRGQTGLPLSPNAHP